jgi:hypothetical protein
MKKLIIAAIAIATITSCNKKRCYQCVMTTYSSGTSSRSTNTICDMTEDDKKKYEQAGTATATSNYGGYSATVSTITVCQ